MLTRPSRIKRSRSRQEKPLQRPQPIANIAPTMTTHNDLEVGSKHEVQHIDLPGGIQDDPKAIALAQEYVPGTAEEKRLVRKMDLHLMPILWVMYIFNYIDRTNIGVSSHLCRH